MIDIYRIKFSKERSQDLTAEERSLFFLLGYAANQIAISKKLTVFATNVSSGSQVQVIVEGTQSQILVRHLVGVVTEAWELIDKRFLNKPIGNEYRSSRLGPMGLTSIAALQKQFGS
jgi:phosphotransferase system HPr-like phosphotransfer protein